MTGLAASLLLVAVGLLVAGLARGQATLQWASFAASVLAALVLVTAELRRRRAELSGSGPAAAPEQHEAPTPQAGLGALVAGPSEPAGAVPAGAVADRGRPPTGAHAVPAVAADGEPPVEEVEVTDLLLVLDLTDEVLVVDEHPRYHLAGCRHTGGVTTLPLPLAEARTDGFTPCGTCTPDRTLAARERARRA
ncbi:hypothetical protein [Modestobacter versicolor]|uniref:hypothetical protein n=1 Tax=Modestobacter versicolor TaxID=429133 RepID=UPI0034DE5E5F